MKHSFLKAIAIFISTALIISTAELPAYSAASPKPDTVIFIPSEFGKIEESFLGKSGKTVICLQDAHDSLEAQENIAKIIDHFVEHYGVKTVFEEGYEGPVPTDKYFSFVKNPALKEKISYFLMDKLRLGGAEYAHVNRKRDFKLIGADSIKLHLENIKQYQESVKHKVETEKDLDAIGSEIKRLADQHFQKELKEWMKMKERFDENKLDLLNYLKRLTALKPSLTIPTHISLLLRAEDEKDQQAVQAIKEIDSKVLFQEIDLLENNIADYFLKSERDRRIFQNYKNLVLLKRLSNIRLSPDEYELVKITLQKLKTDNFASFIVETTGKSIVLSKRWERNIQNAMRFYEIAEARDQLVSKTLDAFLNSPDEKLAVMVFGGFHKNRLQKILKQKQLSCITVTPKITSISEVHQRYYQELMSIGRLSFEPSSYIRTAAPAGRAVEVIADPLSFLLSTPDNVFPKELKEAIRSEMRAEVLSEIETILNKKVKDNGVLTVEGTAGSGKTFTGNVIKQNGIGRFRPEEIGLIDLDQYLPQVVDNGFDIMIKDRRTGELFIPLDGDYTRFVDYDQFERDFYSLKNKSKLVVVVGLYMANFFDRVRDFRPDVRVRLDAKPEIARMRVLQRDGYIKKFTDTLGVITETEALGKNIPLDLVVGNGDSLTAVPELKKKTPIKIHFGEPAVYGKVVAESAYQITSASEADALSPIIQAEAKLANLNEKIEPTAQEISDVESVVAGTFAILRYLFSIGETNIAVTVRRYEKGIEIVIEGQKDQIPDVDRAANTLIRPALSHVPEVVAATKQNWWGRTFSSRWDDSWEPKSGSVYAISYPIEIPKVEIGWQAKEKGRSELRERKATASRNPKQAYVVSVDAGVFDALSSQQRAEFYKLFTARSEVRFVFNMGGEQQFTQALTELMDFDKRCNNVEVRMNPSISGFQGQKIINVTKEGIPDNTAHVFEEKLRGSKDFYPVRYDKVNKEPGLLTAALLLLDAGRDDLMRQRQYFSEISAAFRSEIRQLLESYVYIARSA